MKIFVVGLISFVLGLSLAGFVAIKFFVYGGQSVATSEIQFYSNTLQLINTNNIDEIIRRSCFSLPVALENKEQMDNSFFATESPLIMVSADQSIEDLATKHLSDNGICKRT
ncbi:MAG: hypothetical protein GY928_16235 [Colwellia sp.]|nr:hypothetical protein [Colwellia sp.]